MRALGRAHHRLAAVLAATIIVAGLGPATGAVRASALAPAEQRVLVAARSARAGAALDLIVSLDRIADSGMRSRIARLGTWSWAFRHLPIAAVRVPVGRLDAVRRLPGVRGVYLNRKLQYLLDDSAKRMNTARAWNQLKVTGKGVSIAVLDSGVDFTHPDLASAMKANVKLLEYGAPTPVIPVEGIPNSDTTSGHGTHVAGDVAGRGTQSGGAYRGMAPGAGLVGIGAGDVLFIFTVLEGFDYAIEHQKEYGIRAVTNSWGTEFEPFDPAHPINVATKATHDAGMVVLFAMGNSYDELTINPYAAAPWVIPVAAGTKSGTVTDFSSGGIEADVAGLKFNGPPIVGDTRRPTNMGLYHPAVTATGENVVSTRAVNTVLPLLAADVDLNLSPDRIPYYTTMSGTSMATPEAAGVVALILEANPSLTPAQVRQVLETTAKPIKNVPFFRQGYGYTDASAAVDLALELMKRAKASSRAAASGLLASKHAARAGAVLAALSHPKTVWAFNDPAPAGPLELTYRIDVPKGTGRVKVVTDGPIAMLANVTSYDIFLTDAGGAEIGATDNSVPNVLSGTAVLDLDLRKLAADEGASAKRYAGLKWGTWAVTVTANASSGTPVDGLPVEDTPKATIATVASIFDAPVTTCAPTSVFFPGAPLAFRFQDDEASGTPYPANPSYTYVGPVSGGTLGARKPARNLAGTFGILTEVPGPEALFRTAPLTKPLTIGTAGIVETWIQSPSEPVRGLLQGQLLDIAPDGSSEAIASMPPDLGAEAGTAAPARTRAVIPIGAPYTIKAGHRLGLAVGVTFIGTVADTLYYDSDEFPSGLTVIPGSVVTRSACGSKVLGARKTRTSAHDLPATGVGETAFAILGAMTLAGALVLRRSLRSR